MNAVKTSIISFSRRFLHTVKCWWCQWWWWCVSLSGSFKSAYENYIFGNFGPHRIFSGNFRRKTRPHADIQQNSNNSTDDLGFLCEWKKNLNEMNFRWFQKPWPLIMIKIQHKHSRYTVSIFIFVLKRFYRDSPNSIVSVRLEQIHLEQEFH